MAGPGVVREPVRPRRSRLAPNVGRSGPQAERRHSQQDGPRRIALFDQRFKRPRRGALDHDIDSTALDQFQDLPPAAVRTLPQTPRPLADIQVRILRSDAPPALANLTPRIASGRFKPQHLGATGRQQPSRVGAGGRAGDLDHAQIGAGPGHRDGTVAATRKDQTKRTLSAYRPRKAERPAKSSPRHLQNQAGATRTSFPLSDTWSALPLPIQPSASSSLNAPQSAPNLNALQLRDTGLQPHLDQSGNSPNPRLPFHKRRTKLREDNQPRNSRNRFSNIQSVSSAELSLRALSSSSQKGSSSS